MAVKNSTILVHKLKILSLCTVVFVLDFGNCSCAQKFHQTSTREGSLGAETNRGSVHFRHVANLYFDGGFTAVDQKAGTTQWLSMALTVSKINQPERCDDLSDLTNTQIKVCKWNIDHMETVREGARIAIKECQGQFKFRRWNCSYSSGTPLFGNALQGGTREAAFVHAISAAGVAFSITRSCSSGLLGDQCGCDKRYTGDTKEDFRWNGCSDNIRYGINFSKIFVDAWERGQGSRSPARTLMNKHNNRAGRKVMEDNMKLECKCHGVSGSCSVKTCWRVMPPFPEVGQILKEKFNGASEVEFKIIGSRQMLVPKDTGFKPHTSSDLVYIDASPDFCLPNNKTGSLGTRGRLCNKTSKALDGCELMCCGRGFNSEQVIREERCLCKFHWCCFVQCKKCTKEVTLHYCK